MITTQWVIKTLGKKRLAMVEDIAVEGGVIDIMMYDNYANSEGETMVIIDYGFHETNKTDLKRELISRVDEMREVTQ